MAQRPCFPNFPDGKNNQRCLEDKCFPRLFYWSCGFYRGWDGAGEFVLLRTSSNYFHQEVQENTLFWNTHPLFLLLLLLNSSKITTLLWLLQLVMLLLLEGFPELLTSYTPFILLTIITLLVWNFSALITTFLCKEYQGCTVANRIMSRFLGLGFIELYKLVPICLSKFILISQDSARCGHLVPPINILWCPDLLDVYCSFCPEYSFYPCMPIFSLPFRDSSNVTSSLKCDISWSKK